MLPPTLAETLAPNHSVRLVEDGIYSAGSVQGTADGYDTWSHIYTLVVGNPLYNKLFWGTWPSDYRNRCQAALEALPPGPVLDAGCGSLTFTAEVYAKANRPLILADGSLGMLRKARSRLIACAGRHPEHVTLIQADFLNLPFKSGFFSGAMSWGTLHLLAEPRALIAELHRVTRTDGRIAASSLTLTGRPRGDNYLGLLHRKGHIAAPRTAGSLVEKIGLPRTALDLAQVGSMTFMTAAGLQHPAP